MVKPVSLPDIRKRAVAFVGDWKDEPGEERQQAHQFVADLLSVYGITKTKAALYEKRAQRSSTGRHGYIDALIPGLALIEMKSRGANLADAERQALDYIDSLPDPEVPQYVITSDFHTFRVLDLHANEGTDILVFPLTDLPVRYRDLAFLAGYRARAFGTKQQEAASVKAAKIMAGLYESLETGGFSDHDASVFLVRVLFCLYADDSGVWERDLFLDFITERTHSDGSDLGGQLAVLFQTLNQPEKARSTRLDDAIRRFPYVNGDLFTQPTLIPSFDSAMRTRLIEACEFNWGGISPAIFGSLFQAVKSKEARRELGEHYTTETNILKTINPLFMDELRTRFVENMHNVPALKRLRGDLAKVRVMDPACGCGNFLIVAYRELRALDLDILLRLRELGDTTLLPALFFTKDQLAVTLDHFAGIELEEWPARIAATALHLADHQANQAMEIALGKSLDQLPLDKITSIHVGNALRVDWEGVIPAGPNVRVIGNPPFIGQYTKDVDQTDDMKHVWGKGYDGYLDYVTGWFKKTIDYFAPVEGGRFAFVSTNSIAQGQPVPALFKPIFDAGWRIRFAHQTFAWTSEAPGAAAVHCVITGFDKNENTTPILYGYTDPKADPVAAPVKSINAYLVDGPSVFIGKRSKSLSRSLPEVNYGSKPTDGGHLIVEADAHGEVAADPLASKYLRRFLGARELIHSEPRWCLWLEDLNPKDLATSPFLKARVQACRAFREGSTPSGDAYKLRDIPHLFRPNAKRPRTRYLCIPAHFSEGRRYATVGYYEPDVISGNANFTAPDPDGFAFAVISSSMFLAWQRAVGGAIKSDLRFSNTVVWNNLPLPPVSDALRAQIIAAGEGVLAARKLHPERSLADHYNPLAMDPALVKAHNALDRVVDKAFGATRTLSTVEERQAILFARYAELTKEQS